MRNSRRDLKWYLSRWGVASAEMKKQVKKKLLNFGFCIISSAQDFGTGIS